jgi:SAM-dependent methyltransferase
MNKGLNEINICEVCGNESLTPVLNLGLHPMCDDLVSIKDSRICREYPIEILFCKQCITAHQKFQVPKHELFPKSYHYRSRFTADVLKGMESFVDSCIQQVGNLKDKKVLDIGCNDGSLMDFFQQKGAITIGIEPTDAHIDAEGKGHIIINNYLSEDVANAIVADYGKPDIITFTNVFAHIENLHEVILSLKKLIKETTQIVIENHYLGAILDRSQFDTFYHEHPRTYSYTSFVHMARSLGVELLNVEFPSRYGGNIRVFMGNASNQKTRVERGELDFREGQFFDDFTLLRANIKHWQKTKKHFLAEQFRTYGKLRAKAFPGRAAILIKMLELDENIISKVYEKPGSLKIGNYVPGTRIKIYSDDELFALSDNDQPIINLAWHIPNEIKSYLLTNGYEGRVEDILCENDFSS